MDTKIKLMISFELWSMTLLDEWAIDKKRKSGSPDFQTKSIFLILLFRI